MSAYLALFFACVASGFLVPLPEDVPLLAAGMQVQSGHMGLALALAVGLVGTLVRDSLAFGLGRAAGPQMRRWAERLLGARMARTVLWFEASSPRRRDALLFATRFAVGMRVPGYFVAGLMDLPARRFVVLDSLGLLITTPLLLWAGGRWGALALSTTRDILAHQRPLLIGVGLGAGGVLLALRFRRRVA